MTTDYKKQPHHEFLSASQEALGKASLQIALSRLTDTLAAGNRSAFSALPDSDLLREKARSIKDHTLASLDTYLEQLSDSVYQKEARYTGQRMLKTFVTSFWTSPKRNRSSVLSNRNR